VNLAARGTRNMDHGIETIEDPAERVQAQRQARRVHVLAVLSALAATAAIVALPVG